MWNQLLDLFEKADRSIDIIEGNIPYGFDEIQEIGASPESVLGAVIVNTCGIVFDKWVFVIGQSSDNYGILNFGEKMNYDSSGGFGEGILIYPYLWAKECNIETASKKVVPLKELLGMNEEFSKTAGL